MRWTPMGRSRNVEDRRGMGGGRMGVGLGGTAVLLILSLIFGRDFVSGAGQDVPVANQAPGDVAVNETPEEARRVQFVSFVLDTIQATWTRELPKATGTQYHDATLVLFRNAVQSACGTAQSAMGPFYCPASFGVYLDPTFFAALSRKVGVHIGDFAQAYVVAHEVAHHVQELLGLLGRVAAADASDPAGANARSVLVELQADCYAGVWLHTVSARGQLTEADVEDITTAATVVGDDFQRNQAGADLAPETWTHGSSAQRVHWVMTGLREGLPAACNTFA
jgi:predicted metalloprotease